MLRTLLVHHQGRENLPTDQQAAPTYFVQFCLLHKFYTKNLQEFYMQQKNTLSNCFIQLLYSLMMDQ
jgi:hypothetical protein